MKERLYRHPQWKGFEFRPHGALTEQQVDLDLEMGFAYERSVDFHKDFHTHDRLMLVFPRPGCRMEVRAEVPSETYRIQDTSVLLVPAGLRHDDEGKSAVYDTIAFFPSSAILKEVIQEIESGTGKRIEPHLTQIQKFKRTQEISGLLSRLFFENVFLRRRRSPEAKDLGRALLAACFRELFARSSGKGLIRSSGPELERELDPDPINRAISHLESHLFSPHCLDALTEIASLSTSSLLRHFKKKTGLTPISYLFNRRLEEALTLLRTGDYEVSEVSILVGYQNLGAFSEAFKRKFGKSPSSLLPAEPRTQSRGQSYLKKTSLSCQ